MTPARRVVTTGWRYAKIRREGRVSERDVEKIPVDFGLNITMEAERGECGKYKINERDRLSHIFQVKTLNVFWVTVEMIVEEWLSLQSSNNTDEM